MAFREDVVPECRASCHPPHTDRRRWMVVVREEKDFVVWCCRRCTEMSRVAAIQVRVLPYGRDRARYALNPQHRLPPPRLALPAGVRTEKGEME